MQQLFFSFLVFFIILSVNAAEYETFLPQAVLHQVKGPQPIIGLRLKKLENGGGELREIEFELAKNLSLEVLKNIKIYYTTKLGFQTNAQLLTGANIINKGNCFSMIFQPKKGPKLSEGGALWLAAEIMPTATEQMRFTGKCNRVRIEGCKGSIKPILGNASARLYSNAYRVVPYFRSDRFVPPHNWTDTYVNMVTDFILFQVNVDQLGNVIPQDKNNFFSALAKFKKASIQHKSHVELILGVASSTPQLAEVTADPAKRIKLAKGLTDFAKKYGFSGIDIDWEYPRNETQWENYGLFLAELKSYCYRYGMTITAATAYHVGSNPLGDVLNMFDFVNFMAYDAGREHATMETMNHEIDKAQNLGKLPNYKIVAGLPFYSCEVNDDGSKRNWNKQLGYSAIMRAHLNLKPHDNYFTNSDGKKHYFNGIELLKKKALVMREKRIGGVMIWAYDCDLFVNEDKSAAIALFQEAYPRSNIVFVKATLGNKQTLENGKTWETAFVGVSGLQKALLSGANIVRLASGEYTANEPLDVGDCVYIEGGYSIGQVENKPDNMGKTLYKGILKKGGFSYIENIQTQ